MTVAGALRLLARPKAMARCVSLLLPLVLAACAPAPAPLGFAGAPSFSRGAGSGDLAARVLRVHNAERARVGAVPLIWDPALASASQAYAFRLAPTGRLKHSSKAERGRTGENLWMGTRGAYPVESMVGAWAAERRHFRPGLFPNNSRTGNWADVGHYTAMIWPTTTRVGCGLGAAGNFEVLVCRYAPSGNIDGRRVP